jgi:hypothetical protein
MSAGPGGRGGERNDNVGGARHSEHPNRDGGDHHTLYDPNSNNHISWDNDRDGNYRQGTGHEDRDGHNVNNWDRGG